MTFNAARRLRSLDNSMHSVPKSAVLPYAFGVGGLSRRLLNDVQSRVGATVTRAHVESPLRTELFVTHVQ